MRFPFQPFKIEAFFCQINDYVFLEVDGISAVPVLPYGEAFLEELSLDGTGGIVTENLSQPVDGIRVGPGTFGSEGNKVGRGSP